MRAKLYKISVLVLIFLVLNKILISCEEKNKSLDFIRGKQIELKPDMQEDPEVLKLIEPFKVRVDEEINTPLCYNPRLLTKKESKLETSLGNLLADECFKAGDSILKSVKGRGIDFAIFNYGGLRAPLNQGIITIEDVFQLMPFENRLVIVELNPEQISELLEYFTRQKSAHPISGIRMGIRGDRLETVKIKGKDLNPSSNYHVLTIDYLQHGGNNMTFLTDPEYLYESDLKVRDVLINGLSKKDTLRASLDGRFAEIQ
jgi:5'-nucleotidase